MNEMKQIFMTPLSKQNVRIARLYTWSNTSFSVRLSKNLISTKIL